MSWLPPSDGWLSITDTVALSYEIGWLRHRRIFRNPTGPAAAEPGHIGSFRERLAFPAG